MKGLNDQQTEARLLSILLELAAQDKVGTSYPADVLPYVNEMAQLREYIEDAGEYAVAYESIVATLEARPFSLSGKAAVALLEIGLSMRFKTERPEDSLFDSR